MSPKQFAKQFAATYGQSVPSPSENVQVPVTYQDGVNLLVGGVNLLVGDTNNVEEISYNTY